MIESFSRRMWKAVAFIESGREHFRQLDHALENGDGHAMAAALWTLAEKRPLLKRHLPDYLVPIDTHAEAEALFGKPMRVIRGAAKRMREELLVALAEAKGVTPSPSQS